MEEAESSSVKGGRGFPPIPLRKISPKSRCILGLQTLFFDDDDDGDDDDGDVCDDDNLNFVLISYLRLRSRRC